MSNVTTVNQTGTFGSPLYLAQEFLIRRVGEEAAQKVNIANLVWREDVIGTSSMSGHFRFLNALPIAGAATEASNLPSQSWSPSGVMCTAALDGGSIVESKVMNSIAPEVLSKIAEQAGTSLARTVDSSLASLFPGLTAGNVGSTGAALTFDSITTAIANLNANFAIGQYGIVHPRQWQDLVTSIKGLNYGVSAVQVVIDPDTGRQEEVMDIQGVKIRWNADLVKINSNADYAGAVFTEEALGLVMAQNPSVEILPIPQQHAFTVDYTIAFGVDVIRPTFGCLLFSGISA